VKRLLPALVLLATASCGGASGGASLRFETQRLELGTMHQYEEKEFVLPFTIEGSGAVRIRVLDTSCGCTDVKLMVDGKILLQAEKDHGAPVPEKPEDDKGLSAEAGDTAIELPAGTHGEVRGTYRPERRLNDQMVTVTIDGSMLNSPAKSQIHALIKPVFVVAANAGNFGTRRQAELKQGELVQEVTVQAPAAFQVKFWKGAPANLLIEAVPDSTVPAPGGDGVLQKFRLRLQPDTPEGTKQFTVTAETSLGPAPLDLPVAWRILGPVVYAPEHRVTFANKQNDQDHEFLVKVSATSAEEPPLPKPEVDFLGEVAGRLTADVEELPASGQGYAGWLIRVKLPKGTQAGVYNGSLRISYPADSGIAAKEMTAYARVQEPR